MPVWPYGQGNSFFDCFVQSNGLKRNVKFPIVTVHFALLRDRLILAPSMAVLSENSLFECFVQSNGLKRNVKFLIVTVDFALLRDRLILAPRMAVQLGEFIF